MSLHFYQIKDGSQLEATKSCVNVMAENNHATELYWLLERKDSIKYVKAKLTDSASPLLMILEEERGKPIQGAG